MNTTGRARRSRSRRRISLSIAAVAPLPQKTTTSSSPAFTARPMIRRASSRRAVVRRPVEDASVCVLAYVGNTVSRMKSSMKDSERPEAVASAYTIRRGPNGPSSTESSPITDSRIRSMSWSGQAPRIGWGRRGVVMPKLSSGMPSSILTRGPVLSRFGSVG